MITTLIQLALLFSMLSMLAFGGGAGVIPDMQRAAVDVYHWMTAREFLDMFAISRAAPGPGSQIVVLIGQKAAGLPGAAVAFVAMFLPSCLVVHLIARVWHRAAHAAWRQVVERALAPIAIGLTFASGLALARGTEHGMVPYLITAGSTLAFAFTEIHPVALLLAGAGILLVAGG
ncbi:MAG: chromate transporter [Acetobacteraceae bacterium]